MNERELFGEWLKTEPFYPLSEMVKVERDIAFSTWIEGRAPLLKRIEELSVIADCNRCENQGKVNGCSQEFYCEGCKHHYRGLRDFYKGGTEK